MNHYRFMAEYYCCSFRDADNQVFSSEHIQGAIINRPWLPVSLVHGVKQTWSPPVPDKPEEPPELPGEAVSYVVGLDLGQSRDFPAVVIVERREVVERELVDDDSFASF